MTDPTRITPYRPQIPFVISNGFIPGGKGGIVGVGRDLCAFSYLQQSPESDRNQRRREAELEALRISSSSDAGCFILLWPDGASVWSWDDALVRSNLSQAGRDALLEAPRAPEPLMQAPEIATDGLRLAVCLNGFEGQNWRNGRLVGSRWWREDPSDADWRIYSEALGVVSEHAPAALKPAPLSRPWRRNDWRAPNPEILDRRAGFWIVAGVVATLLSGAAYIAGVELSYRRLDERVSQLEADVGPVRSASRRVTAANSELRRLQAPILGYDGLTLMSVIAQVMKSAEARAKSLQLQGDTLKLSLSPDYRDNADRVIRLLEDEPGVSNARLAAVSQHAGSIELEADLERAQ